MIKVVRGAPEAPSPTFGPLLARLRRGLGLSQLALSLEAGVSSRHLSFLESGRSRPSPAMVERLAEALHVTPSQAAQLRHAAGFATDVEGEAMRLGLAASDRLALHAFQTAADVAAAPDAPSAVTAAGRFFERIGVDHFATGLFRRSAGSQRVEIEIDRCGRPAFGWLEHFRRRDYHRKDAVVARTASGSSAFVWSDLDRGKLEPVSRRILDEAADFRIRDGFVVAIARQDGTVRAFTSWVERLDADPVGRLAARLVATALIETVDRFALEPLTPGLPLRQRELLLAVRDGRSLEPVARRFGLDPDAATAALREACRDMGADTPAHAAKRASRLGLLVA